MRLRKVISGGQTGADRTALECAKKLGLETGGTAPKNWKTDKGPDPSLKDFGLVESGSSDYAVRTRDNVRNAEATVWCGVCNSPGYYCTRAAAKLYGKPFYENPTDLALGYILHSYEILNFAGNRERKYPPVVKIVQDLFEVIRDYSVHTDPLVKFYSKDVKYTREE